MGVIVLIRHGETEWSSAGRHTSATDLPLTSTGEQQARDLVPALARYNFVAALSSPLQRARRTAELSGLDVEIEPNLTEWRYGEFEGWTKKQIWEKHPEWDMWRDGFPNGETVEEVGARADDVLERVEPLLAEGDVALFAHGHSLRIYGVRWVDLPAADGRIFTLSTATLSVLGFDHDAHAINRWNVSP